MATKYLDYAGLQTVWSKVKEKDASVLASAKSYADGLIATEVANRNTAVTNLQTSITNGTITAAKATSATSATNATNDSDGNKIVDTYLKKSVRGATNGVASLGSDGKIPASQLPSYVDDVIEGYYKNGKFYKESGATTEITGETGKIYVDLNTNVTYRYTGNTSAPYCEISSSLALGETSSTAYSGASGKQNRIDINTLLGYFTNGVANKATAITDGGTNYYNYYGINAINTNVNTIKNNYVQARNVVNGLTTLIGTDSKGVGYFYVSNTSSGSKTGLWVDESDLWLLGLTNITLGRDTAGKTYTEDIYMYATEAVYIMPSQWCRIESEEITLTASTSINLTSKTGSTAKAYYNGSEILTQKNLSEQITSITSAELAALLV